MSNEIKMVGYKATLKEYEEIKLQAKNRAISLSAFLRLSVREFLNGTVSKLEDGLDNDRITLEKQLQRADSEIDHLRAQADHLTQLLAIQSKTTAVLTEQNQLLLEDHRRRKMPLLKRIFRWT